MTHEPSLGDRLWVKLVTLYMRCKTIRMEKFYNGCSKCVKQDCFLCFAYFFLVHVLIVPTNNTVDSILELFVGLKTYQVQYYRQKETFRQSLNLIEVRSCEMVINLSLLTCLCFFKCAALALNKKFMVTLLLICIKTQSFKIFLVLWLRKKVWRHSFMYF